uniref:Uncharacterized protein n=1 Tax=Megaselia scalaris TaxID=36166 RepID=T1GX19_MEGSC
MNVIIMKNKKILYDGSPNVVDFCVKKSDNKQKVTTQLCFPGTDCIVARCSFLQTKQQNSFNFIFVILGKVYFKKIDERIV